MPGCEQIRDGFSALLDGELDPEAHAALEEHLGGCAECLRELGGYKKVNDLYGGLAPVMAPDGFEEGFQEKLRPRVAGVLPFPRGTPARLALFGAAAALVVAAGLAWHVPRPGGAGAPMLLSKAEDAAVSRQDVSAPRPSALAGDAGQAESLGPVSTPSLEFAEGALTTSAPEAPMAAGRGMPKSAHGFLQVAKKVEGRLFVFRGDVWQDETYNGEAFIKLTPDSDAFNALAEEHAQVHRFAALGPRVVFRLGGDWYLLEQPRKE